MTVEEHLAVPYLLTVYSGKGDDGRWHRYAEYGEIGCRAEGDSMAQALDRLEDMRVAFVYAAFAAGEPIPVPRAPLRTVMREAVARGLTPANGRPPS